MTIREELEKAADEERRKHYSKDDPEGADYEAGFLAGAKLGLRVGFEKAREKGSKKMSLIGLKEAYPNDPEYAEVEMVNADIYESVDELLREISDDV